MNGKVFLIICGTLIIFLGIKDATVESVISTFFDKVIGTFLYWVDDDKKPASNNRQLPQGDDTDSIIPIEKLEDIK